MSGNTEVRTRTRRPPPPRVRTRAAPPAVLQMPNEPRFTPAASQQSPIAPVLRNRAVPTAAEQPAWFPVPPAQVARTAMEVDSDEAEAFRLVQAALKRERKGRRRMANAAPGRIRNKAQRSYADKHTTAVAAVYEANRRRRAGLSNREVLEVATQLDWRRPQRILPVGVPRRDGGTRTTWSYDLSGLAVQIIATSVLLAAAEVPRWQRALGGHSTSGIVEEVAQDLRDGALWIMHLDIVRCFPSFDAARVAAALPMPRTLALNALAGVPVWGGRGGADRFGGPRSGPGDIAGTNREWDGGSQMSPISSLHSHALRTRLARSGSVCEGSAFSPFAVTVALGDLEAVLPEGVTLRAWSDNLILTARKRRELELAREALARALRGNPAGRLELRGRIRRHDWGTTMLGYHVQTWKGRPIIRPSRRNHLAWERGFRSALLRDIEEGASEPRHSRDFLEGWAGTFRAWSMANMWKDGKLREAARELSAWSQSSGSRPLQ